MKSMPKEIKQKLRKLQKLNEQSKELNRELESIFQEYGVDTDNLRAIGAGEEQTEAPTFIDYAEGDIEDSIKLIEEVFLYYVKEKSK